MAGVADVQRMVVSKRASLIDECIQAIDHQIVVGLANVIRGYYTSLQRSENLGYLVSRDEYRL